MGYSKIYYGGQDVCIDFGLTIDITELNLTEEDNELIEDDLVSLIDECNTNRYADIGDMETIEGGIANVSEPIEDWFHIIVTCYLNTQGSSGLHIDIDKFKEKLSNLYIIGQYVDLSTLDIELWPFEIEGYDIDEPDWDSMPGGHDYYND